MLEAEDAREGREGGQAQLKGRKGGQPPLAVAAKVDEAEGGQALLAGVY